MRHGGWYPDQVLRLAQRHQARFTDDIVHERLIARGQVHELRNPMLHYSYRAIDDLFIKQHRYAVDAARQKSEAGHTGGIVKGIAHSIFTFFKNYLVELGFLDGGRGFIAACLKSQTTLWKYPLIHIEAELREKQTRIHHPPVAD